MPEIPQALLEAAGERLRERLQTRAAPLAERLDLPARHSEDHREVVRGIRKRDRGVVPSLRQRLGQHHLSFGDQRVGTSNRPCRYVTRHSVPP